MAATLPTGTPASAITRWVLPVENSSQPSSCSPRANPATPVLS